MAKLVFFDSDGRVYYKGLLSSKEVAEFDFVKNTLIEEIPEIETDLKEKFGNSIDYKYNLGFVLQDLLRKFKVSAKERRQFWDEIKNLATTEQRKRADGKKSKKRCFFEQCYQLSLIDYEIVSKLSWRQWQSLLDRDNKSVQDKRVFNWISCRGEEITEKNWRELLKIYNFYFDQYDTIVFTDQEVYELLDSMFLMVKVWLKELNTFEVEHPQSLKLDNKPKWSVKFYRRCLDLPKEEDIYKKAFWEVML